MRAIIVVSCKDCLEISSWKHYIKMGDKKEQYYFLIMALFFEDDISELNI